MTIGILGTGNMGRTLGLAWAELGHAVVFGSSDPDKARVVAETAQRGARAGSLDEAAEAGDLVFYSYRDTLPSQVLTSTDALDGAVLVDPNNRPIPDGFAYGPLLGESIAERVQADVPRARVVKAFNTLPMPVCALPPAALRPTETSLYVAGDDADARAVVASLGEAMGLSPVDCGGLRNARMLEAVADFARYLIGGQGLGLYATVSSRVLPAPDEPRFGGVEPSPYH